jgi:hypothetical protein
MVRRITASRLAIALCLFLAACGNDDGGGGGNSIADEIAATGAGKYLGVIQPSGSQANGAWTEYLYDESKAEAICYTGMPYQVNIRPGTANKVLLYLEGGGACWNATTCFGAAPLAKGSAGSAPNFGILDPSIAENPFADWNVVYAPYCDGSVFGGDNQVMYGSRLAYHHGIRNLSAAVTQMLEAFPDPELIVVAGSSAGGFGTYSGYGVARVAYPETQILVFDDSGPGIQNPAAMQDIEERNENWQFRQFIPETCARCDEQITYLTEWSLERDPDLRVAYFNYLQDGVLRFFLGLGADAFEQLLRSVTDDVHSRQGERFQRFFPQGSTHTVLLSPEFYTLAIDGTTVRQWSDGFLDGTAVWRDLVE